MPGRYGGPEGINLCHRTGLADHSSDFSLLVSFMDIKVPFNAVNSVSIKNVDRCLYAFRDWRHDRQCWRKKIRPSGIPISERANREKGGCWIAGGKAGRRSVIDEATRRKRHRESREKLRT